MLFCCTLEQHSAAVRAARISTAGVPHLLQHLCRLRLLHAFDAISVQTTIAGNSLFHVPAVSFAVLDVDLLNVPPSPPAAWFIQATATSADGSEVQVLLHYSAGEVPAR